MSQAQNCIFTVLRAISLLRIPTCRNWQPFPCQSLSKSSSQGRATRYCRVLINGSSIPVGSTRPRPKQTTTLFQEYSHPLLLSNCAICVPCHTACRQLVPPEINFFFPSCQLNLLFSKSLRRGLVVKCWLPAHHAISYSS